MTVGEFFVNLGVKGSEKSVGAISEMKKGMGSLTSLSLETKAALVAAMYALERLFSASGQAGTGLTNFTATIGTSSKTIQQYQYAARQMGVANEEVAGSFRGLQAAMTKTLMGEGAPKGLLRVAQLTGGITPDDIARFQQNPELLMQKLQAYAMKEKNAGLRNEILKSFGVSDAMVAAMTRNAFNPAALKRAPSYSDKEILALDKANVAWSNLGNKIEMAIGHFNAKHGAQLVTDISKIVDGVVKLTEAFVKLADKLKLFEKLGSFMSGTASVVGDLATELGGTEKEKAAMRARHSAEAKKELSGPRSKWNIFGDMMGGAAGMPGVSPQMLAPSVAPLASPTQEQNINVQQTLQFQHDGKDAQKTADSTKKAIQEYYRQSAAQGQSS